ncbi:MAG: DUF1874 domain-containing protein [Thermosphaera sp.]
MRYLVNAFSLNMLPSLENTTVTLHIKRTSVEEFCREVKGEIVNAIGHASTVSVINTMCSTDLLPSRIEVKLEDGDELLIFQLRTRLPEGKVLSVDEVKQLVDQKQVEFLKVKVTIQ